MANAPQHGLSFLTHLGVALLIAMGVPARIVAAQAKAVPSHAQIFRMSVRVPAVSGSDITVNVAPDGNEVYVFPAFFLTAAEISMEPTGAKALGAPKPLLIGGVVRPLAGNDAARINVRATELRLGTAEENAVAAAVTNNPLPAVHNLVRAVPDLPDTLWSAELQVQASGSKWIPIGGAYLFERGQLANHVMQFDIRADDPAWEALDRVAATRLRIRLQGVYGARFTQPTLTATVSFLEARVDSVLSTLISTQGAKDPDFLIPIGGDAHSRFDLRQSLTRSVHVQIDRYYGTTANPADEAFLATFLAQATKQVNTQADVSAAKDDAILKFMLSAGLGISVAKGEVTEAVNKMKRMQEDRLHTLFESVSRHHTVSGSDSDFGLNVAIDDISFGLNFGGGDKYENLDEASQKQVRDEFHSNLDEIEKAVKGKFVNVAAMNVADIRNIVSTTNLKTTFAANQISLGNMAILQSLSLPAVAISGGTDQERMTRLFDACRQDFAPIANELVEDIQATMVPSIGENLQLRLNARPPYAEFSVRVPNAYAAAKNVVAALANGTGWMSLNPAPVGAIPPSYVAQYGGTGGPVVSIYKAAGATARVRVTAPEPGWSPDTAVTVGGGWTVFARDYNFGLEIAITEAADGTISGSGHAQHFGQFTSLTVTGRRNGSLAQFDLVVPPGPGIAGGTLHYVGRFLPGYPIDGTLSGLYGTNGPVPLQLFRSRR